MLILLPGLVLLIAAYFFSKEGRYVISFICFFFGLVITIDSAEHIEKIYYPEQTQPEVEDDV